MTEDMVKLRNKKKVLVDQAKTLLLKYAETCETLRSEYQQTGSETRAGDESICAARARRIALILPGQLLGLNIADVEGEIEGFKKELKLLLKTLEGREKNREVKS